MKSHTSCISLFYFELPNSDRKYKITFDTTGNNDIKKLAYATGMRFQEGTDLQGATQHLLEISYQLHKLILL